MSAARSVSGGDAPLSSSRVGSRNMSELGRHSSLDHPMADAVVPLVTEGSGGSAFAAAAAAPLRQRSSSMDDRPERHGSGSGSSSRRGGGGRGGLLGFVGRLFGALGGKEATEQLVRTASFRAAPAAAPAGMGCVGYAAAAAGPPHPCCLPPSQRPGAP